MKNIKNFNFLKENLLIFKKHLIYSVIFFLLTFLGFFIFADRILLFMSNLLLNLSKNQEFELVYSGLISAFSLKIDLAMIFSFGCSLPFFIWQFYLFIAPGLYKREKRKIFPYLFISPMLFLSGILFCYYFILPNAWHFFLKVNQNFNLDGKIKTIIIMNEYLSMCLSMFFLFGLSFQFPLILNILLNFKIIDVKQMKKSRKFVIVFIFIIAAILTPPDVLSQIILAVPLIFLYEIVIFFNYLSRKSNKKL